MIDPSEVGLPGWLAFAPFVTQPLGVAALTWVGARGLEWLLLRSVRSAPSDAHWTERARRGWPAQQAAAKWVILSVSLGVSFALVAGGETGLRMRAGLCGLAAVVVASGFLARVRSVVRGVPRPTWRCQLRNLGISWLVFFPTAIVLLLGLLVVPRELGWAAAAVMLATVAGVVSLTSGVGVRLARLVGLASPPDARVARVVAESAARVGVTPRTVAVVPHATANAVAFPSGGCLVITEPATKVLDDEELAAVCAHELGHLGEPPRLIRFRQLGSASAGLLVGVVPSFAISKLAPLVGVVVWLALIRVLRRLCRTLEERADRVAKDHERVPGAYARALLALYRENMVPAVLGSRRSVHPHLYDRLLTAGVTPDFARPLPPARWQLVVSMVGAATVSLILIVGLIQGLKAGVSTAGPWYHPMALAITGLDDEVLLRLAKNADANGNDELGTSRWLAAARVAEGRPDVAAYAIQRLSYAGRCSEAEPLLGALDGDRERLAGAQRAVAWCRRQQVSGGNGRIEPDRE